MKNHILKFKKSYKKVGRALSGWLFLMCLTSCDSLATIPPTPQWIQVENPSNHGVPSIYDKRTVEALTRLKVKLDSGMECCIKSANPQCKKEIIKTGEDAWRDILTSIETARSRLPVEDKSRALTHAIYISENINICQRYE